MICASKPLSVLDYATDFYAPDRLDLAPGSLQQIRIAIGLLDRFHQSPVALERLSREFLIDWMRWLADVRRLAPATINRKRAAVMAIWTDAAARGQAPPVPQSRSPLDRVPKRIEPERVPVTWSLPEIDRIFAAAARLPGAWEGVRVSLCWVLGLLLFWDTGGRLAEVLAAEMRFMDVERKTLFMPAEHRKGRRRDRLYTLHAQTMEVFRSTLPSPRRRVFPFPYKHRQIWSHLKRILDAAGLPSDKKHMYHCLRRSAESYAAAERGAQWAADAVGHAVEVARRSYISPLIAPGPQLVEALPRPTLCKALTYLAHHNPRIRSDR